MSYLFHILREECVVIFTSRLKKPIDKLTPDELGVDMTPHLKVLKVTEPPPREAGVLLETPEQLVEKLRNEAKVI